MNFTAEAWRLITPTAIKNCFVKYGFSNDHVSSNNDSALILNKDEEDDWHSLQSLGVQLEDYMTVNSAPEVCGTQSVDQVLDKHSTKPQEEKLQNIKQYSLMP
jgi:hypothetical protein